jgi:pumilio family protein 6
MFSRIPPLAHATFFAGKEERQAKIAEILEATKGRLALIAAKHDSSRVLQRLIKFGSPEQRRQIFDELKKILVKLSLNKYGHFLVVTLVPLLPFFE